LILLKKDEHQENFEVKQEALIAAIISAALVLGLLAGLPLGYIARNFHAIPSGSNTTSP
jgi:hypothetical protein